MFMKFAQFLTIIRERSGLNKTNLADEIGVKAPYIIGLEKGRVRPPTFERLEQIAKVLKLEQKDKNKLFSLAYNERVEEKNQNFIDMLPAVDAPKGTIIRSIAHGIKDVKIPVVSMAKGTDVGGFEFEPIEPHEYEFIDFAGCKAVRIRGSSMAPLAYDGQRVIYSEKDMVRDGDLVFIAIKGQGQFFKRYHKDAKNGIVTLLSINIANHGPLNTKIKDIEFMYKVVGVKF